MKKSLIAIVLSAATLPFVFAGQNKPATTGTDAAAAPAAKKHVKKHSTKVKKTKTPAATPAAPTK